MRVLRAARQDYSSILLRGWLLGVVLGALIGYLLGAAFGVPQP